MGCDRGMLRAVDSSDGDFRDVAGELIDEIAPGGAGFPFQGGVWVAVNSTAPGIACTFGTVSRAGRGETVHPGAVAGTERAKTSTSGRCQAGRLLICGTEVARCRARSFR